MQPHHSPLAHHPVLLLLSALLSRKRSGFFSTAAPLRHGQISELTRLTGTKPLACQDDASAISESRAQFRLSTREGKKLEQVSRTSLCHAVSSHMYLSIFRGLSTVLHLCSPHRLEGRRWLRCQAMAEEAETHLEGQSSHLPGLGDIRSQLLQASNHLMFVASAAFKGNCFSPYADPGI